MSAKKVVLQHIQSALSLFNILILIGMNCVVIKIYPALEILFQYIFDFVIKIFLSFIVNFLQFLHEALFYEIVIFLFCIVLLQ